MEDAPSIVTATKPDVGESRRRHRLAAHK